MFVIRINGGNGSQDDHLQQLSVHLNLAVFMKQFFLSILLGWGFAFITYAQDVRSQLQQLANDLSKQIEAKSKKRVVIASFLSLENKETQFRRYMADKFGIGMMRTNNVLQLTDRSQLAKCFAITNQEPRGC